MRIGLIGDTHGFLPALEAAVQGCRAASVDRIIHCGDFINATFSPDPPDEIIALLRAEEVSAVYGNGEIYIRNWGTPDWKATLAQRMRRPDPPKFLDDIPAAQAALSSESLAWLRGLPGELVLDCARPGDVYVCHAMPGNTFYAIWDADAQYQPAFEPGEVEASLARPGLARADIILCGHVHKPLLQRAALPNQRTALVVRGSGWLRGSPDGSGWMIDYWVLENRGPAALGPNAWEFQRCLRPFRPGNPVD